MLVDPRDRIRSGEAIVPFGVVGLQRRADRERGRFAGKGVFATLDVIEPGVGVEGLDAATGDYRLTPLTTPQTGDLP